MQDQIERAPKELGMPVAPLRDYRVTETDYEIYVTATKGRKSVQRFGELRLTSFQQSTYVPTQHRSVRQMKSVTDITEPTYTGIPIHPETGCGRITATHMLATSFIKTFHVMSESRKT